MKWFVPDSIAGRTVLVLLAGLTVSHILSVAFYFSDRTTALVSTGGEHVGERIATIVQLIERAPESERERILEFVASPGLRVVWAAEKNTLREPPRDRESAVLRKSLKAHLQMIGGRNFTILYTGEQAAEGKQPRARPPGDDMRRIFASVKLRNDGWLRFLAIVEAPETTWSVRFTLSLVVMVAAVLIISALVVRHLLAPLQKFSRAAERLGVDIHAPSLEEKGPREVRHAAQVFNEMQKRILKLVDDRTRMLAAISHDLRTPVTRLRLRADFIEDEEQHEKALRDLDDVESMISSLLSFAREDAGAEARERVDLVALLHSVCDDMADLGHAITFDHEERFPYMCGRLALRRAFTNLLENAIRYGDRARVTFTKLADRIVVRIDDDGPGIPESEQEKAFDAFYRIESSRNRETGGTGVGLYVARTVIRGHGGEITLVNRREGGLRVEVVLPC